MDDKAGIVSTQADGLNLSSVQKAAIKLIEEEEGIDISNSDVDVTGMVMKVASLRPIISQGETKTAVIKILMRLPNDYRTHKYCLYFLRVLDNPSILESDVTWIEDQEASNRSLRVKLSNAWSKVKTLIGLGVVSLVTWLVTQIPGWLAALP